MVNKPEKMNKNTVVGKTFTRREKLVLAKKKYATSEITNETIRALFNSAIVRIEATANIFSLRKTEYNPIANNVVNIIWVNNLDGVKNENNPNDKL